MKKNIGMNFLLVILILMFSFSVYKISAFLIELNSVKNMNTELIEEVIKIEKVVEDDGEEVEKFTVDFERLVNINSDVRGWIRYNQDKINYPIVQSSDNSYYLKHTFEKKKIQTINKIFILIFFFIF